MEWLTGGSIDLVAADRRLQHLEACGCHRDKLVGELMMMAQIAINELRTTKHEALSAPDKP